MEWAGRAFRTPWFAFCDATQRVVSGAPGPPESYRIDPFFLPVSLDVRPIVWLMRGGATNVLLGPNASLFTVVVDDAGDSILWCGVEREQGGAFVEYHVLNDRLDEPWARELNRLLRADRMDEAFRLVFEWVRAEPALAHIDVGVLKVAHLSFFAALQRAWEESGEGRHLPLFTAKALEAVREIVENRWLRFAPDVNLGRALRALLPLLRAGSAWNQRLAQPLLGRLPF
jgi:hypothetical protein